MDNRTRPGWTTKRGLFIDGVWHCDCSPPLPADKFQTKNGGKNHGRWFYTCQRPQPKRCSFFLWSDEAKVREEFALLNNSRSELVAAEPETPRKAIGTAISPPTPSSRRHPGEIKPTANDDSQTTIAGSPNVQKEESFDWPSGDDADLANAATEAAAQIEMPCKLPRTDTLTSPGKRHSADLRYEAHLAKTLDPPTRTMLKDDVFATPTTSKRANGLLSPVETPAHGLLRPGPSNLSEPSSLATSALAILASVPLPPSTEAELVALLNRHDLRTTGIAKGRDITRIAVQAKEKKIAELQTRIVGLEAERETSRAVIAHLKADIANSPTSPRKARASGGRSQPGTGRGTGNMGGRVGGIGNDFG